MENKQIIAQLRVLKGIKPSKEWSEGTKSFILDNYTQETAPSRGFLFSFRPARLAPIAIPAFILMIVGAGVTAHFYLQTVNGNKVAISPTEDTPATYLVLAQTKLNSLEKPGDIKEVADMLEKATNGMPSVSKDPAETAKIVESLAIINKKVQELSASGENAEQVAELKDRASTLTTKTAETLESNIQDTTKGLVKNLIEITETKTLTDEQLEIFGQAKTDYNGGNFSAALEKMLALSENK
jgi:hypothetical protein